MGTVHKIAEYETCKIYATFDGELYHMSIRTSDNSEWCVYLSNTKEAGLRRAIELIDSDAGRVIINDMLVTKTHKLQVGDIVTIKATAKTSRSLGIIKSIQENKHYWVSGLEMKNGFYTQSNTEACYQLENLTVLADRGRWVTIKRDIERQNDGQILQNWIEKL